jgi:ribonuclease T1
VAFASLKSSVSKFALSGLMLMALSTGAQGLEWFGRNAEKPDSAGKQQGAIALAELPAEGRRTYKAIFDGGPFRYEKDGSVFGNRERLLPRQARGHYREYTVETPGARNRGGRRIVCGGERVAPAACWYTADHYASFRRIEP